MSPDSPPGTIQVPHANEEEVDPPERTWTCNFQNEDRPDVSCGSEFPSYKALAMHQRRAHQSGLFLSGEVQLGREDVALCAPLGRRAGKSTNVLGVT